MLSVQYIIVDYRYNVVQQISIVYSSYLTETLCLAAEWRRWARKERIGTHNSIRGIKNAIHKYTNILTQITFGCLCETEFLQPAKQGEKYWTPSLPQTG